MIPVVTPQEMGTIDAAAPEPVEVLIGRAGGAVARCALDMLGGAYGRRVVVLAGKGNNGNDGREAARRLRARGVRVVEIDALSLPESLPSADLVIDAAFGTGFRGEYRAPIVADDVSVLAVDIPSGVDGLTGGTSERVLAADATITFAALKPGLLFGPGAELCGEILVADIGLDTSGATAHLVEDDDLAQWLPHRESDAHKWRSAVNVVGGSVGMEGAATLASRAALRTGAGYVRWSRPCHGSGDDAAVIGPAVSGSAVPGSTVSGPEEVVGVRLPENGWSKVLLEDASRFGAFVVGNGLGLAQSNVSELMELLAGINPPVVVDADAITLLGADAASVASPTTVFTPHEKEFERLAGHPPGADRLSSVRNLACSLGAVVLLKGPTTVVAGPEGRVLVCAAGDSRLATLGTGDVLAGIIGALCARGLDPFHAAAAGAVLHGRAAALGWSDGLIAGDIIGLIPEAMERAAGGLTFDE